MDSDRAYDLIAIDLDGTLLNSVHALPARNRDALHRAHAAGYKIVLCTGRAFPETRPVLDDIGLDLDAAVTVFGAVISDVATGRTFERAAIDFNAAMDFTVWLQERGYALLWLLDRDEAGFDGYVLDGPRRHAAVDRWIDWSPCEVRPLRSLPEREYEPVRISVIDDTPALEALEREMAPVFAERLRYNLLRAPAYDLTVVEAFAPGVNKWHGIERLCRRWRIDPRRTVAIGDDVNDLDMLRSAGLGVAMGNARPEALAAARRATATNDECGVARVIEELLGESA